MKLNDDITVIKGIGDKVKDGFYSLGIKSVDDLVHYFPRTYEKFEHRCLVSEAIEGSRNAIYCRILKSPSVIKLRGKTMITVIAVDSNNDPIEIKYFNANYLVKVLKRDTLHVFRGYIKRVNGRLMMSQPRMYSKEEYDTLEDTIGPIYTINKEITNKRIEKAVMTALSSVDPDVEYLDENEMKENGLLQVNKAIKNIHQPESEELLMAARKRLVFNEFMSFLYMIRKDDSQSKREPDLNPMLEVADLKLLKEKLPYKLTDSQNEAIEDIVNDLSSPFLMNRLIQGDVGSGKTIVAIMALLMCAANKRQGVMMAPTDVLSRQHFNNIKEMSDKYGLCIKPVLLVSKMSAKDRKEALEGISNGTYNVVIGTHAVFQDRVEFNNLSLIITDEQHRFGVNQRTKLREKSDAPNILVMSATPIPRTLAMIIYADLDISIMKDMPKNRIPISNCVVDSAFTKKAYDFIKKEIDSGHQAYVICPMIDESESDNFNLKNVTDLTEELQQYYGDSVRISTLHGKMKPDEKSRIMEEFKDKKSDILVSTTVIEVGIDVENATVILIENAERFGLSQLHQLRGRVGRGDKQSYCILMSDDKNEETIKRLKVLNESNDGFEISRKDMELRGPGQLSGIRQSGELSFAIGNIVEDSDIMILCDKMYESLKERLSNIVLNNIDFRTI